MIDPEELANMARSTKLEQEVASILRSYTDEEKMNYVWIVMTKGNFHGKRTALFGLIPKIGLEKNSLEKILNYGLEVGDASSIDWWLQACANGLGTRNMIKIIRKKSGDLLCMTKVLYFLPRYIKRDDKKAKEELRLLINSIIREIASLRDKPEWIMRLEGQILNYSWINET